MNAGELVQPNEELQGSQSKHSGGTVVPTDQGNIEFDAEWYIRKYPDIAEAVRAGRLSSPIDHYLRYGRDEGRLPVPPKFDAQWYASSYPLVLEETPNATPEALERHYSEIGRHRGYLPYRSAQRPNNAAQCPSPFGGLWIDSANVKDLVDGKCEVGLISQRERQLLDKFVTQGFVILESAVPPDILDRAQQCLERVYEGHHAEIKFECHSLQKGHVAWHPDLVKHPAKALDLHWRLGAVRELGFSAEIARFLVLLFERALLMSQSLAFFRGSGQEMHQDSAYVPYSLPRQFAAAWVALEDVVPGAGELMYFPKSHIKLPEFLYNDRYKSASEAQRAGMAPELVYEEVRRHVGLIESRSERFKLERKTFSAKRGDVLIWHADLAHGGRRISTTASRKSVVFHYSPKEVVPLYAEGAQLEMKQHKPGCYFMSSIYRSPGA
jgi:hypothetical protein